MTTILPTIRRIDSPRGGGRQYEISQPGQPTILLPSVTTILNVISKPALYQWYANQALENAKAAFIKALPYSDELEDYEEVVRNWPGYVERVIEEARHHPTQVRDNAADFGTRAHMAIDEMVKTGNLYYTDDDHKKGWRDPLDRTLDAFQAWQASANVQVELAEHMVYSLTHGYAGSMDALGWRDQTVIALDWKTSSGTYPEMAMQVAAYAKAYEEREQRTVNEAWVIRFSKTPPKEGESGFEAKQVRDINASFAAFMAAKGLYDGLKAEAWK